ncbi:MAG: SOS response-associated peptidase [Pseudomonadota bacterium]
MCGRYALTTPRTAVAEHFDATLTDAAEAGFGNAGPRWNICPTTPVATVRRAEDGGRELVPMRWGFVPHWYKALNGGPLLINARSETIAAKPAFAAAARARRCLIPADGFYEWLREGKAKQPFWAHPGDGADVIAFAGIWQAWRGPDGETIEACAIVTCEAAAPRWPSHDNR